ncbi:hypothetical protein GCM10010449_18790 [Streptomyces rectiviolaceus]|uniref:Uncharacterized protein n=1 Tax=Streptomyces rectiviolaceus TaxID=332591 RepID=A0ABP6MFT2_9ACTN
MFNEIDSNSIQFNIQPKAECVEVITFRIRWQRPHRKPARRASVTFGRGPCAGGVRCLSPNALWNPYSAPPL